MQNIVSIASGEPLRLLQETAVVKGKRPGRIYDDPHGFRARRIALGLNTRELAALAGTNHARIGALESSTPTGRDSNSYVKDAVRAALDAAEAAARRGETVKKMSAPIQQPARPLLSIKGQIPVWALAVDGVGQLMTESPARYMRTPEHMEGIAGVLAVQMRANDMEPAYRPGDVIVANPLAVPLPGSGVILTHTDGRRLLVREFISENEKEWKLRRHSGKSNETEVVLKATFPTIAVIQAIVPAR